MSQMKVREIGKARKSPGACRGCGTTIEVGMPYRLASSRFSGKIVRCMECPPFKPSELESTVLADAYAAQEDASATLGVLAFAELPDAENDDDEPDDDAHAEAVQAVIDDIKGILEACTEGGRSAYEQTEESFDNLPEGFQQADSGQMLQERMDALETWCDDLESWDEPSEWDPEQYDSFGDWVSELTDSAQEVIDGLEA